MRIFPHTSAGSLPGYDTDTDLMRIAAALGVIVIHVSATNSFTGIFVNALSRFSVPVFVIISGYYMLSRRADGKRLAQKSARLFAQMLLWSGIYYGYDLLRGARSFEGVGDMLSYLLTEPVHLWYIYAILTLYLFTPVLFVFVKHASRREYLYALALTFFFGSPTVILLRSGRLPLLPVILDKMKVPYLLGMVFLYLLGGYFRAYGTARTPPRDILCLLGVLGTAISVAGTYLLWSAGRTDDLLLSFFAPNVMAQSIMVFLSCKHLLGRRPIKSEKLRAFVHLLAQNTLGIYLLHPLIIRFIRHIPMPDSTALTIVFTALLAFAASAAAVTVLRAVPLCRRLVE